MSYRSYRNDPRPPPEERIRHRGDVDPQTGLIFWSYTPDHKSGERWRTPQEFERLLITHRAHVHRHAVRRQAGEAGHYVGRPRQGMFGSLRLSPEERLRRYMWRRARKRAQRAGLPFNITLEDVVIPATCPVLGIPLRQSGHAKPRWNAPSIDRIIPALGYVRGNVVVVSFRANHLKNDGTVDELRKVAAFYSRLAEASDSPKNT